MRVEYIWRQASRYSAILIPDLEAAGCLETYFVDKLAGIFVLQASHGDGDGSIYWRIAKKSSRVSSIRKNVNAWTKKNKKKTRDTHFVWRRSPRTWRIGFIGWLAIWLIHSIFFFFLFLSIVLQNDREEKRSHRIQTIIQGLIPIDMESKARSAEADQLLQFCLALNKVSLYTCLNKVSSKGLYFVILFVIILTVLTLWRYGANI